MIIDGIFMQDNDKKKRNKFFSIFDYKKIIALDIKWKIILSMIVFVNLAAIFIAIFSNEYRMFFSNSPISWITPLLPQEPILIIYANIYKSDPLLIALSAGIATFMIELVNYRLLVPICNLEKLKPFKEKSFFRILRRYYEKFPFVVITFVGFTPVPHLPFRILAVLTEYSIIGYGIATFIGRTAFYYVVAKIAGPIPKLPYWVYILFILALILLGLIKWLYSRIKNRQMDSPNAR
jgi:membrane protein YqaA with SNARE-associated domain